MIPDTDIPRLADIAWGEISRYFKPDCCCLATRVFLDVLHALGDRDARPLALCAAFYGSEVDQHVEQHGCNFWSCGRVGEDSVAVLLGLPPGQRAMDAHTSDPSEKFHGHVGVVVHGRVLVDLSAEQANHPEHGIPVVSPLVLPVNDAFVRGRGEVLAVGEAQDGTRVHIRYFGVPGDDWYTINSPDWGRTTVSRALVDAIVARWQGRVPVRDQYMEAVRAVAGRM